MEMLWNLGYDSDLFSFKSRLFMMTFHSVNRFEVTCKAQDLSLQREA